MEFFVYGLAAGLVLSMLTKTAKPSSNQATQQQTYQSVQDAPDLISDMIDYYNRPTVQAYEQGVTITQVTQTDILGRPVTATMTEGGVSDGKTYPGQPMGISPVTGLPEVGQP